MRYSDFVRFSFLAFPMPVLPPVISIVLFLGEGVGFMVLMTVGFLLVYILKNNI